ncbi:hypothetical protein BGW36DRAFT_365139 [Talaromyces proteolyticus]|uniref:NmrA-like domain-containing protein n=1 Tax=Talaromyces proteolyticus TaxID=1131652 RepID=A0AAD4PSN3_9EURO|nr:uncharacterized protein BGW36DRAFT_365139 [Talaromyces proteolyticus]KAH8689368.1 hypothetical protein BGW36DRAFT_365139 [Talaromyces proteolyticus]
MAQDSNVRTVALFGATGNLGSYILHGLLEASYSVTVILRPESKFEITPATINGFPPARIKTVKIPFDDEDKLVGTLTGLDAVVVSISKGGIGAQRALIDAAIKAGVKRFIPSEFGADTLNDGLMKNVPVLREKLVILDYLKAKSQENPNFTWTGISSAAFLDWGIESGFFGFNISERTAVIYSSGTKVFNATTRETIGRAVALVLQSPKTENRYIYIADVRTTQNEILSHLQIQTGVAWKTTSKDANAHRLEGETLLKGGNFPSAAPKLLLGNLYGDGHGTLVDNELLENAAIGLQTKELSNVVASVLGKKTL